jgi:hypothetical protein
MSNSSSIIATRSFNITSTTTSSGPFPLDLLPSFFPVFRMEQSEYAREGVDIGKIAVRIFLLLLLLDDRT